LPDILVGDSDYASIKPNEELWSVATAQGAAAISNGLFAGLATLGYNVL
jgi:hypothetical protein